MSRNSGSSSSDSSMIGRMNCAAQEGNVDLFYELHAQDPNLLDRMDDFPSIDTPLHIAASAGKTNFVIEVMITRPSFARKLNKSNLTPMHLALQNGHWETVKGLLAMDKGLVRVKGKAGRTPLHCVAILGSAGVLIMDEFLLACPDSLHDLTGRRQTAVHLAVKNNNLLSFGTLVNHIFLNNQEKITFDVKDDEGYTPLHLMVIKKRIKMIKGLAKLYNYSGRMFGINVMDETGQTPTDIFYQTQGNADILSKIKKILIRSGGRVPHVRFGFIRYFLLYILWVFDKLRSTTPENRKKITGEAKNVLLVVAVLITTVTFTVGVTPPGGYWSDTIRFSNLGSLSPSPSPSPPPPKLPILVRDPSKDDNIVGNEAFGQHDAGTAILSTTRRILYGGIVLSNFFAFTTSIYMIVFLTVDLPLRRILRVSLVFMTLTYVLSLSVSSPIAVYVLIAFVVYYLAGSFFYGYHSSGKVGKFTYPDGFLDDVDDDRVEIDMQCIYEIRNYMGRTVFNSLATS